MKLEKPTLEDENINSFNKLAILPFHLVSSGVENGKNVAIIIIIMEKISILIR